MHIDASSGRVTTKGDAVALTDAPFDKSLIVGKVTYHVAKLGYTLNFLRSPRGLLLCCYVLALFIVSTELRRVLRHYYRPTYVLRASRSPA